VAQNYLSQLHNTRWHGELCLQTHLSTSKTIVPTCQRASRSCGLRVFAPARVLWIYFSNVEMMPCELRLRSNKARSK
jgi:hypothetical protein